MRQNHKKAQYHECLICHKNLESEISVRRFFEAYPVCLECLSQFDRRDVTIDLEGLFVRILYYYNEFFKSLLFQYKGQYDYALKDAFLVNDVKDLKRVTREMVVAVAPSEESANAKRLFAPNVEIVKSFSHHIFKGLYKKCAYKQSDHDFGSRKEVREVIGIKHGEALRGKDVLLFDDVITSGETLKTCAKLINDYHPSSLRALVLSSHAFFS
jgi:competence protein ComFC